MKRLYFIRHGLSETNKARLFRGQTETDTPLALEGKEQARLAGIEAKHLAIDHIISSPFVRAHETAQIIAREIGYANDKIELNSLLIERHFGALEGTPYTPELDLDMDGVAEVETTNELVSRAALFINHVQALPYENILIVSHGAIGRILRHVADPSSGPLTFTSIEEKEHYKLPNAQIIQIN